MAPSNRDIIVASKEQTYDFFFYGTLCVPAILVRVLGHKCENLSFQDALLPDHTRHCVKGEDYPAIIDRKKTSALLPKSSTLSPDDFNTRGTFVRGLAYHDVQALDIFEGTQYSRVKLPIQTLTAPTPISCLPQSLADPGTRPTVGKVEAEKNAEQPQKGPEGTPETTEEQVGKPDGAQGDAELSQEEAWCYVWSEDLDGLEPEIWSFEQFVKDKAKNWVSLDTTEFDEVERHHALREEPAGHIRAEDAEGDGTEEEIVGKRVEGFPNFGKGMKEYWAFEKDYLNFNHGSYGAAPKQVIKSCREMADKIEGAPDRFMKRSWLPLLNNVRQRTAKLIGAQTDEVVIVPNTTSGVFTVVQNMRWTPGDVIVIYSTTYGAVGQMMKYICDMHPGVTLEIIDVTWPFTHDDIVVKTRQALEKYNEKAVPSYSGEMRPTGRTAEKRVKLCVLDAIASNPGVVNPWEEIVGICKQYGVLSLVDAAHAVGQIKVDVKNADCDFFVSNCHKWLMSARSGAVMYVPLRNQHMMRSTMPTAAGYESSTHPTQGIHRPWAFAKQYEWTGTQDWTPFMSVSSALDFRKQIGGEERIMEYCHSLAVQGGKRMRKLWQTEVMDLPDHSLTAAMVNVLLPDIPPPENLEDQFKQLTYLEDRMFAEGMFAAPYVHGGKWWIRFSPQVWIELDDFDRAAEIVGRICREMKDGKYKKKGPEAETVNRPEDLPTQDE